MLPKDVLAELAKHPCGTFLDLLDCNDSSLGCCDITGESPVWEMHPDTDELFVVPAGALSFTVLNNDGGREHHSVNSGSVFVVPKGLWHKPAARAGEKFLYLTPGQTLHSDAEAPR